MKKILTILYKDFIHRILKLVSSKWNFIFNKLLTTHRMYNITSRMGWDFFWKKKKRRRTISTNKQTLGYRCCNHTFDFDSNVDVTNCSSEELLIDNDLWWNFSSYVGCLLFFFLPILFLKCFTFSDSNHVFSFDFDSNTWIVSNPISFSKMIRNCIYKDMNTSIPISTFLKICSVLMTFCIVTIEIALFKCFMSEFIVNSVKASTLFDWISMVAGYRLSQRDFLVCFGGPYIALAIYVSTFSFLLCLSKDFSSFITRDLEEEKRLFTTLVTIDVTTRGRIGACLNIHRSTDDAKLYTVLKANIYMLINPVFWKIGFSLQKRRFEGYTLICSGNEKCLKHICIIIITPFISLFV